MSIAIDGIVSGLDTSSIIDSMVALYSIPRDNLEDKVSDYEGKQEKLTALMGYLQDLADATEALTSSTDFRAYTASSSDETAVLGEATGEAIPGAYTVSVGQLATSDVQATDIGCADLEAADTVAWGTYTLTYGSGDPVEITLAEDETSLQDLADAINDQEAGVTAYIVNDGSGATPYRLVLVGQDTGAENTITFAAGTTYGAGAVPSFTQTQAPQDATFTVNGIAISSATNEVSGAVPGLSLTLTQATTSPVTIAVTRDTETMLANVQAFVDAYNDVVDYIDTNSAYNSDAGIRGEFVGESSVQRVSTGLARAVTFAYGTEGFTSLGLIGISLDSDGNMSLDEDVFADALDEDIDSVEALFTSDTGFAAALLGAGDEVGLIDVYIDDDTGTLQSRYDSLDSRIDDLNDQIERYADRIERYEDRLRAQYEAMEVTLGALQSTTDYLEALLGSSSDDDS
ncbi:MAG: flagellar filament capping protein FliD [Pseudomonadota bacterium]